MYFVGSANAGSSADDLGPRDDRDGVLVVDGVVELHLDDVADLALGLGAEHVERIGVDAGVRVAHQREQPDLRAVPVGDHEPAAGARRARAAAPPSRAARCWASASRRSPRRSSALPPSATTTICSRRRAHAAGTCCVMQWMFPPPRRISRAGTPTTSRPGNCPRRISQHLVVVALVEQRDDHARRADVEVRVRRRRGGPRRAAAACPRRSSTPPASSSVMRIGPGIGSSITSSARPRASVAAASRARASREIACCGSAGSSQTVQRDDAGAQEARDVVDVPVGLVVEDAAPEPDHPLDRRGTRRSSSSICSRVELRVAVVVQQALLGREQRALAVDVDRAALEHERRAVAVRALDLRDLRARRGRPGPTGSTGRPRGRPRR